MKPSLLNKPGESTQYHFSKVITEEGFEGMLITVDNELHESGFSQIMLDAREMGRLIKAYNTEIVEK